MFVSALKKVEKYTFPVIISIRYYSGEIESGLGAYVVLNPDGWIITASHIIEPILAQRRHKQEIKQYEESKEQIQKDLRLSSHGKRKKLEQLRFNPRWITHISHWWGNNEIRITKFHGEGIADIAAAKLEPFDSSEIQVFPTFWNPENDIPIGLPLCRLGFPFHSIKATFDPASNRFALAPNALPIPRFPLDGIHTRTLVIEDANSGKTAEYIEVSTPGLRGQSGGPVFDEHGLVCGIQSHTRHLQLGFSPTSREKGKEVVEHQFINVGCATHVKEVISFLRSKEIIVTVAPRIEGESIT